MTSIVTFLGPIVSIEGEDTAYGEMHFSDEEFVSVRLHRWKLTSVVQPADLAFVSGKLYYSGEWIMDVNYISVLNVPPFMVPAPTVTVVGTVASFQANERILTLTCSDYICREVRTVSSVCDLSGPRVDKLNSFGTSVQCIITGALRLPEEAKVPNIIAETLTLLDSRCASTSTKVPLTP